eukprot:4432400-Prymnesium_polylepis.2
MLGCPGVGSLVRVPSSSSSSSSELRQDAPQPSRGRLCYCDRGRASSHSSRDRPRAGDLLMIKKRVPLAQWLRGST